MQGACLQDTFPALDFWTPPETDATEVLALWEQVRTTNSDIIKPPHDSSLFYPWSVSTQLEIEILNLEPYGIVLSYDLCLADSEFAATPQNEACAAVLVKDEEAADFASNVLEIRDRYKSQPMFVDLVQRKLILPTPFRYSTLNVEGQWRPERCLDLGEMTLEDSEDWHFPPLLQASKSIAVVHSVEDHVIQDGDGDAVSSSTESSGDSDSGSPFSSQSEEDDDTLVPHSDDGSTSVSEEDAEFRYLRHPPFQTEYYHLLSKRPEVFYSMAIQIANHPWLDNFLPLENHDQPQDIQPGKAVETPFPPPWYIPAASYWLRPVNFPSGHIFAASPPPTWSAHDQTLMVSEVSPDPSQKFFHLPGLNNITMPYFSIDYVDNTSGVDKAATTRLAIAMGTCLYNRFLLHEKTELFRQQNRPDQSHEQGEHSECSQPTSNQTGNPGNTQDLRTIKHYGLSIGMEWFCCWVAELNLTLAQDPLTTDDLNERTTNDHDEKTTAQSKQTWNGCTIHKVLAGDVTSYSHIALLAEFMNNVHNWGMGGYLEDVKKDIRDICGIPGDEKEDINVGGGLWTDGGTSDAKGWVYDGTWESDDPIEDKISEEW